MTILSVLTKIFHLKFHMMSNEDIETYIAFSLTDIDRGIWIYNDNSMDNKTSGSGRKHSHINVVLPILITLSLSFRFLSEIRRIR